MGDDFQRNLDLVARIEENAAAAGSVLTAEERAAITDALSQAADDRYPEAMMDTCGR